MRNAGCRKKHPLPVTETPVRVYGAHLPCAHLQLLMWKRDLPDALFVMQITHNYGVLGDDAIKAADVLGLPMLLFDPPRESRKVCPELPRRLGFVELPWALTVEYVNRLVMSGHRIAIVEHDGRLDSDDHWVTRRIARAIEPLCPVSDMAALKGPSDDGESADSTGGHQLRIVTPEAESA